MIAFLFYIALGAPVSQSDRLTTCVERKDKPCVASLLQSPPSTQSPDYFATAARGYILLQQYESAVHAIDHALQLKPNDFGYLMERGWVCQRAGDQPSAIQSFLLAGREQPDSPEVFYELGMSFFFANENDRAARHFVKTLELDPKSDRAEFMLGVIDIKNEQLPQAESRFRKAIDLKPDSADYLLHHAVLAAKLGQNDLAMAEMRQAEKIDPSNPLTHFNLGKLYRQTGNPAGARAELEAALKSRPNFSAAVYQLGSVYRELGDQTKARQCFQEFQRLTLLEKSQPEDPIDAAVSH